MTEFLIGIAITLGVGLLKSWRYGKYVQKAAKIIVDDKTNPINDPKEALKQVLIRANQARIERMAAELEEMQLDARRDAEAAHARGLETSRGMDITHVDPHTGEESKPQ